MQALEPILLNVNNINRFLVQRKKFGVAQNILRPVKDKALDFDGKIHKFGLGFRGCQRCNFVLQSALN